MTPLEQKISDLYAEPHSPQEAKECAQRLISFFAVLWEIDRMQNARKKAPLEKG